MPNTPTDAEKLASAAVPAAITASSETAVVTPMGAAGGSVIAGLTARITRLETAVADLSNRSSVHI